MRTQRGLYQCPCEKVVTGMVMLGWGESDLSP